MITCLFRCVSVIMFVHELPRSCRKFINLITIDASRITARRFPLRRSNIDSKGHGNGPITVLHRQDDRMRPFRIGRISESAGRTFGRRYPGIGECGQISHLVPVHAPRIGCVERIFDPVRTDENGAPQRHVVGRLLEQRRERHLFGRAYFYFKFHLIATVFIGRRQSQCVVARCFG